MKRQTPTIDLTEAERFLNMMADGETVTFQTFDDDAARKSSALARIVHGDLGDCAAGLESLNAAGAGIFWMVNHGDGAGRAVGNVTGIRALFLDLDGAPLGPVLAAGVDPHAVIESSPDKWHVYWMVSGCDMAQFKPAQQALAAKFGGDKSVCDLPRVLRVPGFMHRKGEPFHTRVISMEPTQPYPFDVLTKALGLDLSAPTPASAAPRVDAATGEIIGKVTHPGRHEYLRSKLADLNWRGIPEAGVLAALHEVNERDCEPPKSVAEVNELVSDWMRRYADQHGKDLRDQRAVALPTDAKWRADQLDRARALLAPTMPQRKAPDYPVSGLGPLAEACRVIAEHAQVQPGMTGQCLLGAASLLTQGLFNVETLAGTRPLSLNLLTLGDSGDGKSQAQSVALGAVHEWQRAKGKAHQAELDALQSAPHKRDEPKPTPPTPPYRICRDATVEGLRRDLDLGVVSQGIFSDEAAAIISGYGMTPENRAKSAAVFSGLWDNGHLSVSRAIGGRVERYGKRLAMHWLIQPSAAAGATADGLLADLGFWPRFLLAWPDELAPRRDLPFKAGEHEAIRALWGRCRELLAVALPDDATNSPVLTLAEDARKLMGQALEVFERDGRRGALRAVKPFALRATEQACRVAGVQAAFAGRRVVSLEDATNALALVAYSLQTWRAVIDDGQADATSPNALRLYEWLLDPKKCASGTAKLSRIVNAGPACVRSKDKRNDAVDALVATKLVVLTDDGSVTVRLDGAA